MTLMVTFLSYNNIINFQEVNQVENVEMFRELADMSKNLTVLYVEDELLIQKKTKLLLETIFLRVDTAINGEEGLNAYQTKKYDLVITDIRMPKKDGISLIRDIKALNHEQSIIVTSAHDDSEKLLELICLGISSFIVKPMNMQKFFYAIDTEVKKINLKQIIEKHMIEQSKLAQMGEMIDAIAHQWKQPISAISIMAQAINFKIESKGDVPIKEVFDSNELIQKQANHIIDTIDTFRKFFRPNQPTEIISLSNLVDLVQTILKNTLIINFIELEVHSGGDLEIECIKSEFIHVFINLINNAKDAFIEKNIENRFIIIEGFRTDDGKKIIKVIDNAGGIPDGIIKDIFEPHFTTKQHENGTGIGLYMSKQILKKINGDIDVENVETAYGKGASFNLVLS